MSQAAGDTMPPRRGVRMNLPNLLTLGRVAAVPVLMVVLGLAPDRPGLGGGLWYTSALLLTLAAGVTDTLDGHLARAQKEVTNFGRFTDPVADKLLATAVFVMLVDRGAVPGWVAVVILGREFAVMALRMILSAEGVEVPVSRWAKIKTIFQVVAMCAVLLDLSVRELAGGGWLAVPVATVVYYHLVARATIYVALAFTVGTGYGYFRRNWGHLGGAPDDDRPAADAAAGDRAHDDAGDRYR